MLNVSRTTMKGKVLLQMADGRIIAYKKGRLVIYERNHTIWKMIQLPIKCWKRLLVKARITERLMHVDARWAIEIDTKTILVLFQDAIYRIDLDTSECVVDFKGFNARPFFATVIDNDLYFGDYGGNSSREPVRIYRRNNISNQWEIAYTFSAGSVRHIHNIVEGKEPGTIYILTGDEDQESGIWMTKDRFHTVEPYLIGSQQFRCCCMLPESSNSGWYLTDAPSETNHVYRYTEKDILKIADIPGTAIYGRYFKNGILFSTTVEPEAHASNKLEYWMTNKPGKGIKSAKASVMYLKDGQLYPLAEYKHDGLPLRLFQYATVYFSNEQNGIIYYSPANTEKDDNSIFQCHEIIEN